MEKVTLKQLAAELNLSTSTVSRALQDSYQIGAETKSRVLQLARRLSYVPNPHASSLGSRRSKTISVVIPEVTDSYFAQAINGIEAVAQERGYHVLIYLTHERLQQEQEILKEFQGGRVDGVIMSISAETTSSVHMRGLLAQQVPLILFDRAIEQVQTPTVLTNDLESSAQATWHLIERGCTTILFLSYFRNLSIGQARLAGYRQALQEAGLPFQPELVVDCGLDDESNLQLIREVLQKQAHTNGIIATAEGLTLSVYQACSELHLGIPADIKVVCFSNSRSAAILNPPLTTVVQPAFETGQAAARLLFKSLKNKNAVSASDSQVLPSKLVVRQSTGG
ncbi:LacI family DNA-binding transcriptional regulator [Hymenobacter bucti]|uniref:LacI family DNA-binding transcriptional regulator n=1 Tax=Hymenobacter bucti TaxID=1844114 RepID=A0ABW4QQJ2_9BACT